MHIKVNLDIIAFFEEIDRCRGEILLRTTEGDVLDLKSELCRMIFSVLSSKEDFREKAWIECAESADQARLSAYLEG